MIFRKRDTMPTNQVRVHHLNKGENRESVLYRLEKGGSVFFFLLLNLLYLYIFLVRITYINADIVILLNGDK